MVNDEPLGPAAHININTKGLTTGKGSKIKFGF